MVETRNVQRVIHTPADEIVLDFGQNFAGWITFSNAVGEGVILYTYILENGLLLRNISKCIVNLRRFAIIKAWQHFDNRKLVSRNN